VRRFAAIDSEIAPSNGLLGNRMSDLHKDKGWTEGLPAAKPQGRSCASHLFGMLMSSIFLLLGVLFMAPLILLPTSSGYALLGGGTFVFFFFWQRQATRRGCFVPVIILAMFMAAELFLFSLLSIETDKRAKIDHKKLQQTLDEYAPGLYTAVFDTVAKTGSMAQQALQSGGASLQNAINSLGQSDSDKKLIMLEEAFSSYPGDPAVVLALADAYMTRNDLAATQLAIALYEALVETDPCDAFLARLADAYGKIFRYDLAFATAVRRAWLPHAMLGRAARQIALLAVLSGDLSRGIFELEKILQLDPVESEEIMLLLAGLYKDIGNTVQAQALLDQVIARTPASLSVAKTALTARQASGNQHEYKK